MTGPVVCAPLRIEAVALRRGLSARVRVVRTGMGPRRAARAALGDFSALAVAGFGGSLDGGLRPGDVVVATEVRGEGQGPGGASLERPGTEGPGPEGRSLPCPSAEILAGHLSRAGLPALTGPVHTTTGIVHGLERAALARGGARVADMESWPLVAEAGERPAVVVRVVTDGPGHPLLRWGTIPDGIAAWRTLSRIGPALELWARAIRPRRVLLAGPASRTPGAPEDPAVAAKAYFPAGPDLVLATGTGPPGLTAHPGVAGRAGTVPCVRVDHPRDIPLDRLADARVIGVLAGPAAASLTEAVVAAIGGFGPVQVLTEEVRYG